MIRLTNAQAAALRAAAAREPDAAWLLDALGSRGEVLGAYRIDAVRPNVYLAADGTALQRVELYTEIRGLPTAISLEHEELERDAAGYVVLEQSGSDLHDIVRYQPPTATEGEVTG